MTAFAWAEDEADKDVVKTLRQVGAEYNRRRSAVVVKRLHTTIFSCLLYCQGMQSMKLNLLAWCCNRVQWSIAIFRVCGNVNKTTSGPDSDNRATGGVSLTCSVNNWFLVNSFVFLDKIIVVFLTVVVILYFFLSFYIHFREILSMRAQKLLLFSINHVIIFASQ